jgi:ribosomal protein S18 acetylase RimI-like enzyme
MLDLPDAWSGIQDVLLVTSSLGFGASALLALRKLAHVDHFYQLVAPIERLRYPRLRSDVRFTPATEADFAEMVRGLGELDVASRHEVLSRVFFGRQTARRCAIGRDGQGALVSMQWLFRPGDRAVLEERFRNRYEPLRPDEVLIENIFIYPQFRAGGVFPTINHAVLDEARREGFRTCTAYVRKDNVASLNGYLDLGFRIRRLLTSYSLAGRSWRTL